MRRRTFLPLLLSLILILSGMMSSIEKTTEVDELTSSIDSSVFHRVSQTHSPVIIEDDIDFELQGWPGNGTKINPYVIRDLEISGNSSYPAIQVGHVYSYFLIENCILFDGGNPYVVTFFLTFNGVINDCRISDSAGIDIHMFGCESVNISRCQPVTGKFSIGLVYSTMCNMLYNTNVSIGLVNSTNCEILHNQFGEDMLYIDGPEAQYWSHDVENNTNIHGKIALFSGRSGQTVDIGEYSNILVGFCSDTSFEGGSTTSSVRFEYTDHCTLAESDFFADYSSVSVRLSNHTTIDNCKFNPDVGFLRMSDSSNIVVSNCDINLSFTYGRLVWFENCYAISLLDNNLSVTTTSGEYGDSIIVQGDDSVVSGNRIEGRGFWFRGVNSRISDNVFQCHTEFQDSNNTTIRNNTFTNVDWQTGAALRVATSDNVTIVTNSIIHNDNYGVYLQSCSNCMIYENQIGWNFFGNAYDSLGENNTWDDGISTGNSWSDYSGEGQYEIDGSTGSVDRYPSLLVENQNDNSTTDNNTDNLRNNMMLWVAGIAGIAAVGVIAVVLQRKKG